MNTFFENEESFKTVADFMPQFVWLADEKGHVFWFNKSWHDYTEISKEQLAKDGWEEVPHPSHLHRVIESFKKSLENETPWEETFLMKSGKGDWQWFLTRANPIRDENEKIIRWLGCNTDITKQKEAEQQILNSETRYKMAGLATKDVIWDWNLATGRISFNQALSEELKHPESFQESSVYWWEKNLHPEDKERVLKKIKASLKRGAVMWKDEYRFLKGDGHYAVIYDRGYIAKDQNGKPARMIGAMMDVTWERMAMEHLKEAKRSAETANKAKTAFLANMSHEIRTPLSAILGFVELLKTTDLNEGQLQEFLSVIERNSQQLLRIIDDVLDLSRVEAGSLSVERVEFCLDQLLDDIVALMEDQARKKGVKFVVKSNFHAQSPIISDPVRIKQILINVVGNAIKFTKEGKVELEVNYHYPHLYFRASDTGIGIAKELQEKIFEPFNQGDVSTSREFGGTGLGLALAKKLSQSMGGDFYLIKSEKGKGSVFESKVFIELPSEKTKEPFSSKVDKDLLKGLKILVIDDSEDNRLLTQTLLSGYGAIVESAASGAEGLELALEKKHDIILLDIRMPTMDGYEVLEKLQKEQIEAPVVALTAHAMQEERFKALHKGFSAFLTKPLNVDETLKTMSNLGH